MKNSLVGMVAALGVAWGAQAHAAADFNARADGAALTPLHRVDPEFPGEAVRAGAQRGRVTARMTLDASGRVTSVEIVEALPRRLFDGAVKRALADWRYAEGAAGRVVEIEIAFRQ